MSSARSVARLLSNHGSDSACSRFLYDGLKQVEEDRSQDCVGEEVDHGKGYRYDPADTKVAATVLALHFSDVINVRVDGDGTVHNHNHGHACQIDLVVLSVHKRRADDMYALNEEHVADPVSVFEAVNRCFHTYMTALMPV